MYFLHQLYNNKPNMEPTILKRMSSGSKGRHDRMLVSRRFLASELMPGPVERATVVSKVSLLCLCPRPDLIERIWRLEEQ